MNPMSSQYQYFSILTTVGGQDIVCWVGAFLTETPPLQSKRLDIWQRLELAAIKKKNVLGINIG
jgi:hypothetical protein